MKALVLALFAVAAATAAAQPAPAPGPGARGPANERLRPPFVLMRSEGAFERETVRGAPYAARTETELVQNLADGNRIAGRWTGFVARDSEGRVRREQPLGAIGVLLAGPDSPRLIVIHDPVQRATLFLDADTRTARRVLWPDDLAGPGPEGRSRGSASRGERPGPLPPAFERRGPLGLLPPGMTITPTNESLGWREIAGVTAQGTRSTYVIPAGRIGNERELSIVSERWTSAELNAVLETRLRDPRTGETRFRMTEIDRREPDHGLFEVPAGFIVDDGPPRLRPHDELAR